MNPGSIGVEEHTWTLWRSLSMALIHSGSVLRKDKASIQESSREDTHKIPRHLLQNSVPLLKCGLQRRFHNLLPFAAWNEAALQKA